MSSDLNSIDASPGGLLVKPIPQGIVWLNKNSVVAATVVLMIVGGAIIYGGIARGNAAADDKDAGLPALIPANAEEIDPGNSPGGNFDVPGRRRRALATSEQQSSAPLPASAPTSAAGPALSAGQSPEPSPGPGANAVQAPLTPAQMKAQQLREARAEAHQRAMAAGTTSAGAVPAGGAAGLAGADGGPGRAGYTPALQQLQALAGMSGGGAGAAGRSPGGLAITREEDDPNGQARKHAFMRSAGEDAARNTVKSTRQAAISPYEVKAGWIIPAVMEHGINSDLPGQLTALVSQNVFDSATGRFLLIPQGARLVGLYDSQVSYGQDGLMVAWRRIMFPDGSSVDLEGMGGTDESGYAGFRDRVDNHYGRLIGFGVLTSLLSAAYQITQPQNSGTQQSPGQVVGSSVAQNLSQLGIEVARKNLRVQPTVTIRPGYQFTVRVDKDLIFSRGYADGNVQ